MNVISNELGNKLIYENLLNENKIFIGRMGITELQIMFHYINKIPIPNYLKNLLINNAGVYGDCFKNFCEEYLESINKADAQVYWNIPNLIEYQNNIFENHLKNIELIDNRSVEPFYFDEPWSFALKNKKVLVVHPFIDSIKSQYLQKELLFDNKKILPNFELITYKSVQSIGGQGPHKSWIESLDFMKNDISNLDFDVAILGCGAYGMPLGSFIKHNLNKTCVYIGGGLQLLFGIKGNRWDNHEFISKLYNSYWVRPNKNEIPLNYKSVEDGCYW